MDINEMIRTQMKSGMSTKEIANAFTDPDEEKLAEFLKMFH